MWREGFAKSTLHPMDFYWKDKEKTPEYIVDIAKKSCKNVGRLWNQF